MSAYLLAVSQSCVLALSYYFDVCPPDEQKPVARLFGVYSNLSALLVLDVISTPTWKALVLAISVTAFSVFYILFLLTAMYSLFCTASVL